MTSRTIETDYLVVGAGAAGMAFTDALIADSNADVVMVERRHAPGGHWLDAYPFVRLHQPAAYYGVNSMPLGGDAIDRTGYNAGFYEQATAPQICAYYHRVMQERLVASGRVRFYPMCDYVGEHRFVSRLSGEQVEVKVRRALVDAKYLQPSIPAKLPPPFEVAEGTRCVPINALASVAERVDRFTILGAGKTAIDACLFLLEHGVPPESIRWVKPREAWLLNRYYAQCGELVGQLMEGIARQMEAAAQATSVDDLFARLESSEQLLRVDEQITPTMYKAPTVSVAELEQLRRIRDVVRLGKVRRIDRDEIVLDRGTVPTTPATLHVHCAASGLNPAPAVPIFAERRITLQAIRVGLYPFNAALIAYVESTRPDLAEKNRLCPPNANPDVPRDWIRGTLTAMQADYTWSKERDVAEWLERSRLNAGRGARQRRGDPAVDQALKRFAANAMPGLAKLMQLS